MNFPLIFDNIRATPVYGICISLLTRYSRYCGSYHDFLGGWLLLTKTLLHQGFLVVNLKSSFRKFHGHHHDSVKHYGISVQQMTTYVSFVVIIISSSSHSWLITRLIAYPEGLSEFITAYLWGSCCSTVTFLLWIEG